MKIIISILVILLFNSCAVTPSIEAWRPWTRILSSTDVSINDSIKIIVEGITSPLNSDNTLLQSEIKKNIEILLIRRGFNVVDVNEKLILTLKYSTNRHDKMGSYSSSQNYVNVNYLNYTGSGSASTSGLGVGIASVVSALSLITTSTNIVKNVTSQISSFTNSISLEINDKKSNIIWSGDSYWDTRELNLISDINLALKILISNLPKNKNNPQFVEKVKKNKFTNFYNLKCRYSSFHCPALPYKIRFQENDIKYRDDWSFKVEDSYALAAYVDLISNAEFAFPNVHSKFTGNPFNISLWKKVQLGEWYNIGDEDEPSFIIIELKGQHDKYLISDCYVASEKEALKFEKKLNSWITYVNNYFDVYEK